MTRLRAPLLLLLAALLYLGMGLYSLYPAWLSLEHGVVGDWRHPDMVSNHWMYRWVADTVAAGDWAGLLHNTRYYYPIGDSPILAGNGNDAVLRAVVGAWIPWPGGITAWALLALTLNGLGGLALARAAGARWGGAVFAGSVLALSPYVAHELSGLRLAQVPLYPMAFFLAAWLRALQSVGRARTGWALMAGGLYALTAALYWYYGLWAAGAGAALLAARGRWRDDARVLPPFLLAAVPPVAATLALFLANWDRVVGTGDEAFPHPLATEAGLPVTFPLLNGSVERHEIALSLVTLGLCIWGARVAWSRPDRRLFGGLLAVAAVFLPLCWGPELLLPSGESTGIPGPFQLVYGLHPTLRRFWWPYRHAIMVTLALLPFAALGVDAAAARAGAALRRPTGKAAMAALTALTLVYARAGELDFRGAQLWTPVSWWEAPAAYTRIQKLPGDAIFELPAAPQVCTSQQTLSYQWVHQKQMVNGHAMWVDRVRPDAWDAWVADNTFLSTLQQYERGQLFGPFAFKPEDVVKLREAGVRHIVVNAEYYPRALYPLVLAYQQVLTGLFGPPVFQFRDTLFAWDLEAYGFQGMVEAPEFRLPPELLEGDGDHMLDLGYNRPLGWRTMARLFPPVLPTAASVPVDGTPNPGGATEQPGLGAVPDAPGAVPPHREAPSEPR